jgi:hypothetical protein
MDAAVIFAPRHLVSVLIEIPTADPMMLADLGAPQPGEERFGLVCGGAVFGLVFAAMVDPAGIVGRVQALPGAPRRSTRRRE